MADTQADPTDGDVDAGEDDTERMVTDPAGLVRVANMLQALTSEVREMELDEGGRSRLFEIQRSAMAELSGALSDDLANELHDLGLPVTDPDATSSELRLAQSQLVGWLNGLFQGIQAAMLAQQSGAAQQLQQMRRPELEVHRGQYL